MKKNILLSSLLILAALPSLYAQKPSYYWTRLLGGSEKEYVNGIALDRKGNVYTTGSFEGPVDMDPGASTHIAVSNGSSDIFITKLDDKGVFQWSKTMGGYYNDIGYSIVLDSADNVYVTGTFQGSISFGTTALNAMGDADIFVAKYDPSGSLLWAKSIGGSGTDYGRAIAVDTLGGVFVTGKFETSVDFDPGSGYATLSANMDDAFLLKLDAYGNFQWAKALGGSSYDVGSAIAVSPSGSVYAGGLFSGTVNFDPPAGSHYLSSQGIIDAYIVKYDNAGNYQWAKTFGGSGNDYLRGLSLDAKGNVYPVGYFTAVASFDPLGAAVSLSTRGGYDGFIAKVDQAGTLKWIKQMGGSSSDYAYAAFVDDFENVYTTGAFQKTVDFDPSIASMSLSSNGSLDAFITKYDKNGDGLWAINLGGSSDDEGTAIAVYKNKDIYTAGDFSSNAVDFDNGSSVDLRNTAGMSDVFIHKMSMTTNGIATLGLAAPISLYPNPNTGTFYVQIDRALQENYSLNILDAAGNQVMQQSIQNAKTEVDLSAHASGIYFVRVASQDGSYSEHFSILKR